jgi:O-acetyl-ADP-ribose deacetylase (regulator of RNase III)
MTVMLTSGDLLEQKVDAIINTVNTVGVMGKGVALQFKRRWPENFRAYESACKSNSVKVGEMFIFDNGALLLPKYIVNFPTKQHWRSDSRLEFIEAGLKDLVQQIRRLNIRSIAMPPLGCGNGGLAWEDVEPRIRNAFAELADVEVRLFAPNLQRRALAAEAAPPRMTSGRAAVIAVLSMYQRLQYALTQIEVQKLMYFLVTAGEPMTLRFEKGKFGPYAPELNHVLLKMEGAYITGLGDLDAPSEIQVQAEAVELARAYLKASGEGTAGRVERISALIEGFETPFGMELLATVHWAARHIGPGATTNTVQAYVEGWNDRKRRLMSPTLVDRAYMRLKAQDWLDAPPLA